MNGFLVPDGYKLIVRQGNQNKIHYSGEFFSSPHSFLQLLNSEVDGVLVEKEESRPNFSFNTNYATYLSDDFKEFVHHTYHCPLEDLVNSGVITEENIDEVARRYITEQSNNVF